MTKKNIWNQKMMDLSLKDSNGNRVRVVIHDDKLEKVIEDVTVFIKWRDGLWYPCKNLNLWQKAFEITRNIAECLK